MILEINDPEGDDYGPGTYTYPTDTVFPPKAFDLKSFKVSHDENNLIFKIEFYGPIPNPWGSPNNLAIQTVDIYIDTDPGLGSGARALLPGRNLSLEEGDGWDFVIWAEGWTPQIMSPDPETLEPKEVSEAEYRIIVDSASRSLTIRVAKTVFEESNYDEWGFVAIVMGQEGFPSTGVWRVRDVIQFAEQWRFGGAGNTTNHTRVIDMIWPENEVVSQADMLSGFIGSNESADNLSPDDYALIKLLIPEKE
ncbi:MAG TPA: glucodextranase DOMON-like domain-containing protein [Anaerolineaceae bacterium]|nr:glucodextranase DOMON-like domain-containing protein [Anaerolineaceae bacterium]